MVLNKGYLGTWSLKCCWLVFKCRWNQGARRRWPTVCPVCPDIVKGFNRWTCWRITNGCACSPEGFFITLCMATTASQSPLSLCQQSQFLLHGKKLTLVLYLVICIFIFYFCNSKRFPVWLHKWQYQITSLTVIDQSHHNDNFCHNLAALRLMPLNQSKWKKARPIQLMDWLKQDVRWDNQNNITERDRRGRYEP